MRFAISISSRPLVGWKIWPGLKLSSASSVRRVLRSTRSVETSVLMLRPNSPSYQLVGNADRLDKREINGLNTYLTSIWIMLSTIDAQFTFDVIMMASKYVESCMKKADKLVKEGDDSHDADILKDEEEKFNMEKKIDADIAELDKTMKGKMQ